VALSLLLPRALQAALLALAGTQALVGVAGAAGEAPMPTASLATLAVDRPVPGAALVAAPVAAPAPAAAAAPEVVVGPGDTLWGLAARHLPPGSPASAVAAAWPRWYRANREVIGPDPDLLAVGLVLQMPVGTQGVDR
jgi:nucleoid-associated protein YgaU